VIGGAVIAGLGSENEEAVAADGVLVDALATACRPLTLARPADGRARVVRVGMRFTKPTCPRLARRLPPLSRGPPMVPSARAMTHYIQVLNVNKSKPHRVLAVSSA
jgi:hypothetical protein